MNIEEYNEMRRACGKPTTNFDLGFVLGGVVGGFVGLIVFSVMLFVFM